MLSGAPKEALKSGLSDMEYLRSKVTHTGETMEESKERNEGEEANDEDEDCGLVQHTDSAYESGENTSKTKGLVSCEDKKQSKAKENAKQGVTFQRNH